MLRFYLRKTLGRTPRPKRAQERGRGKFDVEAEFALSEGSMLGVIGPSGSGKTTLLRCLAGLERPDAGRIEHDSAVWFDAAAGICLPIQKRGVGLVFQDYALFPNMTALGNVLYGNRDEARALELLDMVGLSNRAGHYPRELSGGQKQRCALARALARGPGLLLMDEPLSALDEELREGLGATIRALQRKLGISAVMVTHSRAEASRLCDEILELKDGRPNYDRYPLY